MDYDIVIVGAGPAGLSFARSLADSGLNIALIEKQPEAQLAAPEFDGRDIALTHLSVRILKELGIWARFKASDRPAIKEARVLDGKSPYSLNFDVKKEPLEELGYLVSNHVIRKALFDEIRTIDNISMLFDLAVTALATDNRMASTTLSDGRVLKSRLVIAADSRFSALRRMAGISASMHDFGRVCIVCRMEHQRRHNSVAFECFDYGRTLAVLPLSGHQSSIVLTAPMDQRDAFMNMDSDEFGRDIRQRFNSRYGEMTLTTRRFAYPLVGVHATTFYARRFALVGDAAVGMHPVTAHGYNLGLSGANILATEITKAVAEERDIGASALLERYSRKHMRTTKPMYHGTNEIVKFFTDDRLPARLARKVALRLANNVPPLKNAIRRKLTQTAEVGGLVPSFSGSK
ncbi:MAG: 5-demethoxyubiquinol-8 5-hydroxylase UbiM [Gammaproteobacteria bacterium]|nr:5-demethoxyubiquinol-8 5-hydroxylase UbiM [Gammaproteobacteria bacterium]